MSGQDVGFFDIEEACPDLVIENGDLKADNSLETPALISVFSDKRVTLEEAREETDRRGWWADLISEPLDDEIGSKLWLLESIGKVKNSTAVELESILFEAFQWMIDDGLAKEVIVSAERTEVDRVDSTVQIIKPQGENIPLKFAWDGQALKLISED